MSNRAFTLIEMMIVIAILGVMVTSALNPRAGALAARTLKFSQEQTEVSSMRRLTYSLWQDFALSVKSEFSKSHITLEVNGERKAYLSRTEGVYCLAGTKKNFYPGIKIQIEPFFLDKTLIKISILRSSDGKIMVAQVFERGRKGK